MCAQAVASLGLQFDDVNLPLLLHAVYGNYPVKLVFLLRDPVARLEGAFWCASHTSARHVLLAAMHAKLAFGPTT